VGNLAHQCGLLVAKSPPTFAIADRYDQGPMEVFCDVIADSGRESHGSNPRRLSATLGCLRVGQQLTLSEIRGYDKKIHSN